MVVPIFMTGHCSGLYYYISNIHLFLCNNKNTQSVPTQKVFILTDNDIVNTE